MSATYNQVRSRLYEQFNFSDEVAALYDLEQERQELKLKVERIEGRIEVGRKNLPPEITSLYDQWRTANVLQGNIPKP